MNIAHQIEPVERIKISASECLNIEAWRGAFFLQTSDNDYAMGVIVKPAQLREIGERLIAIADGAPLKIEGDTE